MSDPILTRRHFAVRLVALAKCKRPQNRCRIGCFLRSSESLARKRHTASRDRINRHRRPFASLEELLSRFANMVRKVVDWVRGGRLKGGWRGDDQGCAALTPTKAQFCPASP